MSDPKHPGDSGPGGAARFPATRWSLVLAAGQTEHPDARRSLEALCETYWEPLYAFLRRKGEGPDDARDLVQGFFAAFLEGKYLKSVRAERGRFRSYLLGAMTHFLADERDRARATKRGGGLVHVPLDVDSAERRYSIEPVDRLTPERLYERRWALSVLGRVLTRLGNEHKRSDKGALFERLKVFLVDAEGSGQTYTELARELDTTEGALKVAIHRLRRRYRDLLREEVADTVADPTEVDAEIRRLFEALGA